MGSSAVNSRLGQAWSVLSDVLIAIALIWTLPLLLGAAAAALSFAFRLF